jgi:hypothetical protein
MLPPSFEDFLAHVDGWECFYHDVTLFGTREYEGSILLARANEVLGWERDALCLNRFKFDFLVPFGVATEDTDVWFFDLEKADERGEMPAIWWYAGEVVERQPTFRHFFVSILELLEDDVHHYGGRTPRELARDQRSRPTRRS